MNITYSNTLLDITSVLRKSVYNTQLFQNALKNNLENIEDYNIYGINITPDYYGGLDIDINSDNYDVRCNIQITNALVSAIESSYIGTDKLEFMTNVVNFAPNLCNIISTGVHSLLLKI